VHECGLVVRVLVVYVSVVWMLEEIKEVEE
jgi:hypothetical protein